MVQQKDRPLTVRELQAQKKQKREAEQNKIRIRNVTKLQPVPLQLYGKESKAAVNQITIHIGPGKSVDLPEYRLIPGQIINLRKKKLISTTKMGASGKTFKDTDYKQFLPAAKKAQKVDLTRSGKGAKASSTKVESKTNKSSKKKTDKITKSEPAE